MHIIEVFHILKEKIESQIPGKFNMYEARSITWEASCDYAMGRRKLVSKAKIYLLSWVDVLGIVIDKNYGFRDNISFNIMMKPIQNHFPIIETVGDQAHLVYVENNKAKIFQLDESQLSHIKNTIGLMEENEKLKKRLEGVKNEI